MIVIITPKAQKELQKIPNPIANKLLRNSLLLEVEPFSGKKLTGKLKEFRSLRAWPYRIIYWIDTTKNTIFVISFAHRQGAYK